MKALLAASLVILPALIGGGEAKAFSYYNPYKSSYNKWKNQFSGYDDGHSSYRKQIRSMNPYGVATIVIKISCLTKKSRQLV